MMASPAARSNNGDNAEYSDMSGLRTGNSPSQRDSWTVGAHGDGIEENLYEELREVYRWFHPDVDRHQAEQILAHRGENGSFLVRQKKREPKDYVVSLRWEDELAHINIDKQENRYGFPGNPRFSCLPELIRYHTEQDGQLLVAGKFVSIKHPIQYVDRQNGNNTLDPQYDVLPSTKDQPSAKPKQQPWYQISVRRKQNEQDTAASDCDIDDEDSTKFACVEYETMWSPTDSEFVNPSNEFPIYENLKGMGVSGWNQQGHLGEAVGENSQSAENREQPNRSFIERNSQRTLSLESESSNQMLRSLGGPWETNIGSVTLNKFPPDERTLQESLFEILTSEASYLKSMSLLIDLHMPSMDPMRLDMCKLRRHEYDTLFSNYLAIRKISSRFMVFVETEWKKSHILNAKTICSTLADYAQRYYYEYVKYVGNFKFQQRQYEELRRLNTKFSEWVQELEKKPVCGGHDMLTFLSMPFQRMMRMHLLLEAVARKITVDEEGYQEVHECWAVMKQTAEQCNQKVKQFDVIEQIAQLVSKIDFGNQKQVALASSSRFLVAKEELTCISTRSRLSIQSQKTEVLTLILFNDILLITKKRGDIYLVMDHAPRKAIHTELINDTETSSVKPENKSGKDKGQCLFKLVLGNDKKRSHTISCKSPDERLRWIRDLHPNTVHTCYTAHGKKAVPRDMDLYENTRGKQVQAAHGYNAENSDEITLQAGDTLKVLREENGWIKGERFIDGKRGWFPADVVQAIDDPDACIANLREKQLRLQQSIDAMEQARDIERNSNRLTYQ